MAPLPTNATKPRVASACRSASLSSTHSTCRRSFDASCAAYVRPCATYLQEVSAGDLRTHRTQRRRCKGAAGRAQGEALLSVRAADHVHSTLHRHPGRPADTWGTTLSRQLPAAAAAQQPAHVLPAWAQTGRT